MASEYFWQRMAEIDAELAAKRLSPEEEMAKERAFAAAVNRPMKAQALKEAQDRGPVYYHGGPRGLRTILPSSQTGVRSHAAEISKICRRDRVYVTTDFSAALLYAACHDRGVVYEVMPDGVLEPDPDCSEPGLSWECRAAAVTRVHKPKGKHLRMARKAILA